MQPTGNRDVCFAVTGLAPATTARLYFYYCIPAGSKLLHPVQWIGMLIVAIYVYVRFISTSALDMFKLIKWMAVALFYFFAAKPILFTRSRM